MSDGTLSIRRRQEKGNQALTSTSHQGVFDSFLGAKLPAVGEGAVHGKMLSKPLGDIDELRVENRRTKRLKDYDRFLKNFKYSAALDSVLRKVR